MNVKLLAVIMIAGLVLSGSSVFLNKMASADDQWSNIAQRQLVAEQRAAMTYASMYTFNNMNASESNWSGLGYTTTGGYGSTSEVTRVTSLGSSPQAQISEQNALAGFDKIHILQLQNLAADNYTGLNSTTTDEQGRDRNALISQAKEQSLNGSTSLIPASSQLDPSYANLAGVVTTNEQASYDRQAMINKVWGSMDTQASALVSTVGQKDPEFTNIGAGPTTGTYSEIQAQNQFGAINGFEGPQLSQVQQYALDKAVGIFQEIHAKGINATQTTDYVGLTTSTTNEVNQYPRNMQIADATQMALENALNYYDSYYNGAGINQTLYSH